jgi:hypothetical protein
MWVLMASPSSLRPYGGTNAVRPLVNPAGGTITGEAGDGLLEPRHAVQLRGA